MPWKPRSAKSRAAVAMSSSVVVAHMDDATDRSVGRQPWTTRTAGVPRARPVRRAGRDGRLDARRVPRAALEVRRDARELGADGRAARARLDPPRADAAAQARAHREDPGRGRPRAAASTASSRTSASRASACLDDLVAGKSKFHNVFHYPTKTWGDVGVIAWLVDAAAIISQKALLKCSYAPYARIMRKICWEESFHILHGRDVILTLVTGHRRAARAGAGGARPLVGAADDVPRQPDPGRRRPDGRTGGSRARRTRRRASSSSTATCRRSGSSA